MNKLVKLDDKSIRLSIIEDVDTSDSSIHNYNMYATAEFEYRNIKYSELCFVKTLFVVEMESDIDNAGKIKSVTSETDPSSITKSDIDSAISTRIDEVIEQINLKDKINVLSTNAYSYNYDYPMENFEVV